MEPILAKIEDGDPPPPSKPDLISLNISASEKCLVILAEVQGGPTLGDPGRTVKG
jgi:hypothetical protein